MPENKQGTTEPKRAGPSVRRILPLATLCVLIAIAAAFYFYTDKRLSGPGSRAAYIDHTVAEHEGAIRRIDNFINDIDSRFADMEKRLENLKVEQDSLNFSIAQDITRRLDLNLDYALAEVQYLLVIASHHLQLDYNIETAISVMETADKRLEGLRYSGVSQLREQLHQDMGNLRSLDWVDLSEPGLYLSDLIDDVDSLPLKEELVSAPEPPEPQDRPKSIKQFFQMFWQGLKDLVKISRNKTAYETLLLPDSVYYLRANIKLELANARFALFNRDPHNLRASIGRIQKWLHDYFNTANTEVKNVNARLDQIKKLKLIFPELNISSSLESVNAFIRMRDVTPDQSESSPDPSQ